MIVQSSKNIFLRVKMNTKSLKFKFNLYLIRIDVTKGRIHKELVFFLEIF